MKQSFQLPDLIGITTPLTQHLRVNPHCYSVSTASEAWLRDLGTLSEDEMILLGQAKPGLLVSLVFPDWDQPQLRHLLDFLSLVIISNTRLESFGSDAVWIPEVKGSGPHDQESGDVAIELEVVEVLKTHVLLQAFVRDDQTWLIRTLRARTEPAKIQTARDFLHLLSSYRKSQTSRRDVYKAEGSTGIGQYVSFISSMWGYDLVWTVAALLDTSINHPCSTHPAEIGQRLVNLSEVAMNVVTVSMEILSFSLFLRGGLRSTNNSISTAQPACLADSPMNLVSTIADDHDLSKEGALSMAGVILKNKYQEFCDLQHDLLHSAQGALETNPIVPTGLLSTPRSILSQVFSSRSTITEPTSFIDSDIRTAIQRLKDLVIGTIHWGYESELFFGTKGHETRDYGWIFVDTP